MPRARMMYGSLARRAARGASRRRRHRARGCGRARRRSGSGLRDRAPAGRRRRRAGRGRSSSPAGRSRSGRRCRRGGRRPRSGPSSGSAARAISSSPLQDLPVGGPREQRQRPDDEDRQQDQEAAAGIGPTQHRSSARVDQRAGRTTGSPSWPRPASRASLRTAGSRPSRLRSESSSWSRASSRSRSTCRRPMS